MNLAIFLQKAAAVSREEPAVALGGKEIMTFSELAIRSSSLAYSMKYQFKLQAGERVAVILPNTTEYIEILFACWWAGLIAVPVNFKLNAHEVKYILEDCDPKLCFIAEESISNIYDIPHAVVPNSKEYNKMTIGATMGVADVAPDDIAWLFYTSGTTGKPKGAMLSHRNLITMTACYFMDVDQILPGDSIVHAAPMSHGSGLYIIPHMAARATQVIPESKSFNPAELSKLFNIHSNVSLFAAPTMVKRLVAYQSANYDPGNLKSLIYGGGPMYLRDCKLAIEVLGNRLIQIYGQGESPMTITALSKAHHSNSKDQNYHNRIASVGTPQSLVEVCVIDNNKKKQTRGHLGEILVRGDTVMSGYWKNLSATQEKIVDGWLHTGDIGFIDSNGFITLKDRTTDLIISGGINIYPREIEELLLTHPNVSDCAVVGVPDPEWGESITAFIVPTPKSKINSSNLDTLCLTKLARFKRPRRYTFIDELPKNNYGKVLKRKLRQNYN